MNTKNQPPAVSGAIERLASLSQAFRQCKSVSYSKKPAMHREANAIDSVMESHAALVAALEKAVQYLEAHRPKGKIRDIFHDLNEYENGVMKPARAALAAAKGVQS